MLRRPGYRAPRTLLAALALGLGACHSVTDPETELQQARARWARHAPASYSIIESRSCECLPGSAGPVEVTVRDGAVVSRHYLPSGEDVPPQFAGVFPAVEGLFALVDAGVRAGTRPADVRYDRERGFPTRVVFGDPGADAPLTTVSGFVAR